MSWLVLVNPRAGGRSSVERARAALGRAGIAHDLVVPTSAAEMVTIARREADAGRRDFAVVGGDGTANIVVDALLSQRRWSEPPTIAILPAGSGSDFIRTFGLPRTIDEAVEHLATDDRYRCDVGRIEGRFGTRYFLNAANAGIAARSASIASRLPSRLGGVRYTAAFWIALGRFAPGDVVVRVGRHRFEGSAMNVVVANGQFFGGGLNVAPRASVADGLFDVQVFAGPRRNAFTVMPRVIGGHHLTHRAVRRYVGASVEIDVPETWPVEADGEALGRGPVAIEMVQGAIDMKI